MVGPTIDGTVPALVAGASGYVGGELLRLLYGHPGLAPVAASRTFAGTLVEDVHPHLAAVAGADRFIDLEGAGDWVAATTGPVAVFSALPHGQSATFLDDVLARTGDAAHVVDLGADFRLGSAEAFECVYGVPHGAPHLADAFFCGLPDLESQTPSRLVAHPGCFTTAVTLAARPLVAGGLVEGPLVASCVTGSTGSGREPKAATHHPTRHGNLKAYAPLAHRHVPEMKRLIGRAAEEPHLCFIPHSGPFARGIHATLVGRLTQPASAEDLVQVFRDFYRMSPFVRVSGSPPALKHVVGTNDARLGIAVDGRDVVVLTVIDNLTKGAAGGAVQWMNRLMGWEAATGLALAGTGWS